MDTGEYCVLTSSVFCSAKSGFLIEKGGSRKGDGRRQS